MVTPPALPRGPRTSPISWRWPGYFLRPGDAASGACRLGFRGAACPAAWGRGDAPCEPGSSPERRARRYGLRGRRQADHPPPDSPRCPATPARYASGPGDSSSAKLPFPAPLLVPCTMLTVSTVRRSIISCASTARRPVSSSNTARCRNALERITPEAPDLWAQVYHAIREEWALTAEDIIYRRTTLACAASIRRRSAARSPQFSNPAPKSRQPDFSSGLRGG